MLTEAASQSGPSIAAKRNPWKRAVARLLVVGGVLVVGVIAVVVLSRPAPPQQLSLGDGRILLIEGVTYGTQHRMGGNSVLERFRPWLPGKFLAYLGMDRPTSTITLDRPGLVVWVNAISAVTPTNVDCQRIRVEFVDRNGDVFGTETSSWHGSPNFSRVGHMFTCYPRDERELALRVTTWKGGKTSEARIANPVVVKRANWTGKSLPQSTNVGEMEITLNELVVRTNGGTKKYWESPAIFFEPVWECRQNGTLAIGWEKPEWFAEDANGNRGRCLGAHQPVLRFFATAYPEATNARAAKLFAALPQTDLTTLNTNLWWNKTNSLVSTEVTVLGLFLPGTHTFSEGAYESSTKALLGPRGGAPTGWTGSVRRLSPTRVKESRNHYTPSAVLYVRYRRPTADVQTFDHPVARLPEESDRLAVRLRDDHGQYWVAKAESAADGIYPFLLELPAGITNVVPEVVLLKPVHAEFAVETKSYLKL